MSQIYIPQDKMIRKKWLDFYYKNDSIVKGLIDKKRSKHSIENALLAKCVESDELKDAIENK